MLHPVWLTTQRKWLQYSVRRRSYTIVDLPSKSENVNRFLVCEIEFLICTCFNIYYTLAQLVAKGI